LGTDTHTQIRAPLQHCFFRTMSLWTLSVVTLSGNQADIEVDPASSPSEVLAALGDFAAAERGVQRDLLHEEQRLMWDTTLAESGVADGSTLTLVRTTLSEAQQEASDEALTQAAASNDWEAVERMMLQAGANINAKFYHRSPHLRRLLATDGSTPLHVAAESGRLDIVTFLVEAGAKVDTFDSKGETPLSKAAVYCSLEIVKYLAEEAGAKANTTNSMGDTPLSSVYKYGREQKKGAMARLLKIAVARQEVAVARRGMTFRQPEP